MFKVMGSERPVLNLMGASLAIFAVIFLVAGCGGDDSSDNGGSGSGSIDVPEATIAYGELVGDASESAARQYEALKGATDALGWELKYIQGEGDVPALTQGLVSAVNAGADALYVTSTDTAAIRPAIQAAESKGIPIVAGGGASAPDGFDASFQEDEEQLSATLTEAMVEELGGAGKIGAIDNTQILPGQVRQEAREATLDGTDIDTAARSDSDLADLIGGSKTATSAMLAQEPDLDALWLVYDAMMPPSLEALKGRNNTSTKVYSFFANPSNLEVMRKNKSVSALAETNIEHTGLIFLDQLAANLKDGTEINPDAIVDCPLEYTVVTRDDIPKPGAAVFSIDDEVQAFVDNWTAGRFGEGADCGK